VLCQVVYELEKVLDKRFFDGQPQYYIKWKNFTAADNSWEPLENLAGSEDAIRAFEAKKGGKMPKLAGSSVANPAMRRSPGPAKQEAVLAQTPIRVKGSNKAGCPRGLTNKVVTVASLPQHPYYFILNYEPESTTCQLGAMFASEDCFSGARQGRTKWKVHPEGVAGTEFEVKSAELQVVKAQAVNKVTNIAKESWDILDDFWPPEAPPSLAPHSPGAHRTANLKRAKPVAELTDGRTGPSPKRLKSPLSPKDLLSPKGLLSPRGGIKKKKDSDRPRYGKTVVGPNKAVTIAGVGHRGEAGSGGVWYVLRHDPDEDWARVVSMSQVGLFPEHSKYSGKQRWKVEPEAKAVELQVPCASCTVLSGNAATKYDDVEKENWIFEHGITQESHPAGGAEAAGPTVLFGNTHEALKLSHAPTSLDDLSQEEHRWILFLRGSQGEETGGSLDAIEKVIFHLTEDFDPSSVEVLQAPFQCERVGWGVFDAKAEVHLKAGGVVRLQHSLSFEADPEAATAAAPLGLDWGVQQKLGLVGRC